MDWSRLEELQQMEAQGMPGLTAKLVRTYLENSQRLLAELDAAMIAGNADAVRRAAHSIKSTAANIGAPFLSQLGRSLELASQSVDWQSDAQQVVHIIDAHRQVTDALKTRFP